MTVLTKTQVAAINGHTLFPKNVKEAPAQPTKTNVLRVLKEASNNTKLSGRSKNRISRGPASFRGLRLYNLTLIERMTCPTTCQQWDNCYGNHMPFAKRYKPGPELQAALVADIAVLDKKHPEGFVIRLHILGDFYSTDYVAFWSRMIKKYRGLHIYGYTHWQSGTPIGDAITDLVMWNTNRVAILRSDKESDSDPLAGAYTVAKGDTPRPDIVVCPQQTGKTESCLTCGLCFHGNISVQFLEH